MYKLFLTLRYLTRKKIVIFPILVVWLCLMMMIIVTSIMGGFVERVRKANRELLGDVVISTRANAGFAFYEELQEELRKIPEVQASTPVARGYSLITFPTDSINLPAQIVGVDPVSRSQVSRFHENLYRQYIAPSDAADDLAKMSLPKTTLQLQQAARDDLEARRKIVEDATERALARPANEPPQRFEPLWLNGFIPLLALLVFLIFRARKKHSHAPLALAVVTFTLGSALVLVLTSWPMLFPRAENLRDDQIHQAHMASARAFSVLRHADFLPPNSTWTSRQQLANALIPKAPSFNIPEEARLFLGGYGAKLPDNACFVGSQFGIFRRDSRGNFVRSGNPLYYRVNITVIPVSEKGTILTTQANSKQFILTDDSYSGVYDVDSSYVYAPLETVQTMAGMRSQLALDDPDWTPPRVNEILIKIKGDQNRTDLYAIRDKIDKITASFAIRKSEELHALNKDDLSGNLFSLNVETWDQKQKKYLDAVQNEKSMQIFILGLMSCVVLVVIFLIFYMIVRDKTRDIGIIKAVGGSETGVATIFLLYGLFIGVVGGALGVASGVAFVTHTNEIHEWIFQITGKTIWDRSVYLFDRIPSTVNYREVAFFYLAAIISGVLGALIPAFFAAQEDPAKAVRFE